MKKRIGFVGLWIAAVIIGLGLDLRADPLPSPTPYPPRIDRMINFAAQNDFLFTKALLIKTSNTLVTKVKVGSFTINLLDAMGNADKPGEAWNYIWEANEFKTRQLMFLTMKDFVNQQADQDQGVADNSKANAEDYE